MAGGRVHGSRTKQLLLYLVLILILAVLANTVYLLLTPTDPASVREYPSRRDDLEFPPPSDSTTKADADVTAKKNTKKATADSTTTQHSDTVDEQYVACDTTAGKLMLELHPEWSPAGARRLRELVTEGFYSAGGGNAIFRYAPRFMIQFGIVGDPTFDDTPGSTFQAFKDDKQSWQGRDGHNRVYERGMVGFAASGPNSRNTQTFIMLHDYNTNGDWQPPCAVLVEDYSFRTLDNFTSEYGDLPSLGGHGPSQRRLAREGNAYTRKNFPNLDYILDCQFASKPVAPVTKKPKGKDVRCETSAGDFTIVMNKKWAPLGHQRFMELVEDKFFDDQIIYRVLPGFLVQFGVAANAAKHRKWNKRIKDDPQLHVPFTKGTVSFAGGGRDSRTSHIFISDEPDGNGLGHALHERPFGRIEDVKEQKFLNRCNHEYGDITFLQGALAARGNDAAKDYPHLTRIRTCYFIDKY